MASNETPMYRKKHNPVKYTQLHFAFVSKSTSKYYVVNYKSGNKDVEGLGQPNWLITSSLIIGCYLVVTIACTETMSTASRPVMWDC